VLGLVAATSGLLIVLAYELSRPYIEENRRVAVERAVFRVIPGAVRRTELRVGPEGVRPPAAGDAAGETVHAGYDEGGRLLGVAMQAAAHGYQDTIRVLYGYSPECQCITGMTVLQMAETPGIGDKIATDPTFLENFKALDARPDAAGAGLAHPIQTVRHGTKKEPWQIDAISGATISSRAIGKMLNQSAERNVPILSRRLDVLKEAR
jgi:electron transport complex protein RnfG